MFSTRVESLDALHTKCSGSTSSRPRSWLLMHLRRTGYTKAQMPTSLAHIFFRSVAVVL